MQNASLNVLIENVDLNHLITIGYIYAGVVRLNAAEKRSSFPKPAGRPEYHVATIFSQSCTGFAGNDCPQNGGRVSSCCNLVRLMTRTA